VFTIAPHTNLLAVPLFPFFFGPTFFLSVVPKEMKSQQKHSIRPSHPTDLMEDVEFEDFFFWSVGHCALLRRMRFSLSPNRETQQ
jgi:hypothetical protein